MTVKSLQDLPATVKQPQTLINLQVAEMLNGNPMGGKRRSAYHYDIWCLKYLPKFKWDHLTEEIGEPCNRRRRFSSIRMCS